MKKKYEGEEVLDLFTEFGVNRNNAIAKLIFKSVPDSVQPVHVLEFGAGKGNFINRFMRNGKFITYAVEPDPDFVKVLSENHKAYSSLKEITDEMDFIFLIDVLEHLEDDNLFLEKFFQKIKPGGKLFIYVPAGKKLYSSFDRQLGHYRRYNKKELSEKIIRAGFKIEKIRYHEIISYFLSFIHNKISGKSSPSTAAVKMYDRFIIPATNKIEQFFSPPFGKSVYVSAVKPDKAG